MLVGPSPLVPCKKSGCLGQLEGRKSSKHTKMKRRGGTVHSLQEKRLSRRQKKERNSIQPPTSPNILFLAHPPVTCLDKEAIQNQRDDIQDPRLCGLTVMSHS